MSRSENDSHTNYQKRNIFLSILIICTILVMTWAAYFSFVRYDRNSTIAMYKGRQAAVLSLVFLAFNTAGEMSGKIGLKIIKSLIIQASRDPEVFRRVHQQQKVSMSDRIMVGYGNMIITFDGRPVLVGGEFENMFTRSGDYFEPVSAVFLEPFLKIAERLGSENKDGLILSEIFDIAGGTYIIAGLNLPSMPDETVVFLYADSEDILKVFEYYDRKKSFALFGLAITLLALICGAFLVRGIRCEIKTSGELVKIAEDLKTEISERKKAEEEKDNLREQLLQSQKMEAIGTLAGGIAHEFNNMLAVIMGNADCAIIRQRKDEKVVSELEKIKYAVERSKELSLKLLTFARKDRIATGNIRVCEIFSELMPILERSIPKNIRIEKLVEDDALLNADLNQILQALYNVCANARDAMPEGGVIKLEVQNVVLYNVLCPVCAGRVSGCYCRILISDSGSGISAEMLGRVFDPFFTTKDIGSGTGLGLSISLGIIQNHGGHIRISSEPGKGTVTEILLPIADEEKDEKNIGRDIDI